jgi:hypothetical protein
MIEYHEPIKGNTVDIYVEPDGTLSFEWYNTENIMADEQKLTIEALRGARGATPIAGFTEHNEVVEQLWEFTGVLLDYIEQQDARIKALEDQLAGGIKNENENHT